MMKQIDKLRYLMDITTRQQLFIEGIKKGERAKFEKVLRELSDELSHVLQSLKYNNLDQLTTIELNVLLVKVRKLQTKVYSRYLNELQERLKTFMQKDINQTKRMYAYAITQFNLPNFSPDVEFFDDNDADELLNEKEEENTFIPIFGNLPKSTDAGFNKFWALITASALPANGVMMLDFINAFSTSAQASIENLIRQGYVNGWAVSETIAAIVGISSGDKGQLNKISNQNSAVVSTVLQFVAAMSGAAVSSGVFGYYTWLSVMDNRTTVICRTRNLKIYEYGKGPLPPAHIRCRSHTMPVTGSINLDDRGEFKFYNWASRQPLRVLVSIFGLSMANAIKDGSKEADEFTDVESLEIEDLDDLDDILLM